MCNFAHTAYCKPKVADPNDYEWQPHSQGLFQTLVTA